MSMTIKLFVGQIPKSFTEESIRQMFTDFGAIEDVALIKNKVSNEPQGCAFVTMSSQEEAERAIETLHNSKKYPGVLNPLQVKYADSEQEKLSTKLFVGMLPRSFGEDEIRMLFSTHGVVEDICILRGPNNESKGCGFIKFQTRDSCLEAIRELNGIKIEGSSNNLVVKFADTEKDKKKKQKVQQIQQLQRQQQQIQQQLQQQMTSFQPKMNSQPLFVNPYLNMPPNFNLNMPPNFNLNMPPNFNFLPNSSPSLLGTPPIMGDYDMYSGQSFDNGNKFNGIGGGGNINNMGMGMGMGMVGGQANNNRMNNNNHGVGGSGFGGINNGGGGGHNNNIPNQHNGGVNGGANKKFQSVGPNGSNLFVYNIPNVFSDQDLSLLFQPYGLVVSAKVYLDKNTGTSKGFGFISYDNPGSASAAISNLNGYMIGGKKLKVSLKQAGHGPQPY
eukprot:gene1965-2411_t